MPCGSRASQVDTARARRQRTRGVPGRKCLRGPCMMCEAPRTTMTSCCRLMLWQTVCRQVHQGAYDVLCLRAADRLFFHRGHHIRVATAKNSAGNEYDVALGGGPTLLSHKKLVDHFGRGARRTLRLCQGCDRRSQTRSERETVFGRIALRHTRRRSRPVVRTL